MKETESEKEYLLTANGAEGHKYEACGEVSAQKEWVRCQMNEEMSQKVSRKRSQI